MDMYGNVIYMVPRYQREYTWEKKQWNVFFDDILLNNSGYFLGSMICINRGIDALGVQKLELVDGQQRMITLSLMLAAIFSKLKEDNLRWMLVRKMNEDEIRVEPQIMNDNNRDYRSVLFDACVLKTYEDVVQDAERKPMFRAYRHFQNRLNRLSDTQEIMKFRDKVLQATIVKIEVPSTADAYMLFESLNNRGTPLTSVDLIKNKLFARLKEPKPGEIDFNYDKWNKFLEYIGDDHSVQERFFRQYYNAFKETLFSDGKEKDKTDKGPSIATRSNIIKIYEEIIQKNPVDFLSNILKAGKIYSMILGQIDYKDSKCNVAFKDLARIEGTPSYLLLLYLIENKDQLKLCDENLLDIIKYLASFFVRRNLTDKPATNSLTPLFMKIISEINGLTGVGIVDKVKRELVSVSSNDEEFRKSLEGPIYSESSGVARFILCTIEEQKWPTKIPIDLWAVDEKGKYRWTIEHILPQCNNLSSAWVDMIAGGNKDEARNLQGKHLHSIGNLTLTVFNSELSNMSFEEKRDRKDRNNKYYIGYKSELHLNEDLRVLDKWGIKDIEKRKRFLVNEALKLFSLNEC